MENEVKGPTLKYNYTSPEERHATERVSEIKYKYYDKLVKAIHPAAIKPTDAAGCLKTYRMLLLLCSYAVLICSSHCQKSTQVQDCKQIRQIFAAK